jgi:hypothetical protein
MSITDRLSLTAQAELDQIDRDDDTIQMRKIKQHGSVKIEIIRGKTVIRTVLASSPAIIAKTVAEHFAL